jgi:hypothetical protein
MENKGKAKSSPAKRLTRKQKKELGRAGSEWI